MEQKALQKLVEDISRQYFHKEFRHTARFNKRLRTTGGRYLMKSHDIELNPKHYQSHGDEELRGIIKHELCHYHLHLEGKGYQHRDKDFRELMKKVGAPRFCKSVDTGRAKEMYRHLYQCEACKQRYYRKRRVNLAKYRCGKCRGKLEKIESE